MTEELLENVKQWFIDRGLDKADPKKQLLKFTEEVGELAQGIAKNNQDQVVDSLGDIAVVAIGLALQIGIDPKEAYKSFHFEGFESEDLELFVANLPEMALDFYEMKKADYLEYIFALLSDLALELTDKPLTYSLEMAYNEIKDRKGKLVEGVFIKEEDLK